MGNIIDIPIRPGRMLTDRIENDLGFSEHQEVRNLRQLKIGEWELVEGYKTIASGFTDLKAGVEVTEDVSSNRFLLFQDGTAIKRVDYDINNSPLFGYENETASTLTLPSGTTIGASAVLRFFVFRGVVRISGASQPLWYGFVDNRTLFNGDDSFTVNGWFLEPAPLLWTANDVTLLAANDIPDKEATTQNLLDFPSYAGFMKFFYVFDGSQYQLMRLISNLTSGIFGFAEEFPIGFATGVQLQIRVPGSSLKSNMFNKRVTGVGIAFAVKTYGTAETSPQPYLEDKEPFFVPLILNISDDLDTVAFVLPHVDWDSTLPNQLTISDPDNTWNTTPHDDSIFLPSQAGYLGVGVTVKISRTSSLTTKVASIDFGDSVSTKAVVTFDDSLASLMGSTGLKNNVGFSITPKWIYDTANGYHTFVGLNTAVLGTEYFEFTGIPSGTLQNTPNWVNFVVVDERAYVTGQTGDVISGGGLKLSSEEDSVRHSPVFQFDNFPIGNVIQTEVGDTDKVLNIIKRDNRLAILKKKSISQGGFAGGSYSEDISISKHGLFSELGVYTATIKTGSRDTNEFLLLLDEDDIYLFNGITAVSFFESVELLEFYKARVTNSSFILLDKLNNELWFILGTTILVWREHTNEFYIRTTDITPVFGFLDFDNKIIVASSTKLVTYNHGQTTFDESMSFFIKTKVFDAKTQRRFKKNKELISYMKSNSDVTVTFKDDGQSLSSEKTIGSTTAKQSRTTRDTSLFKELYLEIKNSTNKTNLSASIRESLLRIEVWRIQ